MLAPSVSIKDCIILIPMAILDLFWPHVRFFEPGKSSSLVTTLLNCTSLLQGGLLKGEWDNPWWWPSRTIAGAKTSSREQGPRFDLVWTLRTVVVRETHGASRTMCRSGFLHVGCTSIRFAATLGYEWPLVCSCYLIICLIVLMAWMRGWWLWFCYHGDYCITLLMPLTTLLVYWFACML
jgi:hypothetical protein